MVHGPPEGGSKERPRRAGRKCEKCCKYVVYSTKVPQKMMQNLYQNVSENSPKMIQKIVQKIVKVDRKIKKNVDFKGLGGVSPRARWTTRESWDPLIEQF